MARPLSLLSLNLGSPYNNRQRQDQQLQGNMPLAPWQNNGTAVKFPVPPVINSSILGGNPIRPPPNNRSLLGNAQAAPPWQKQNQNPPSLLDGINALQAGMQRQNNSNQFSRNMDAQRYSNSSQTPQNNHSQKNLSSSSEIGKKTLDTPVTKEFRERVKGISNPKNVESIALEFARKEYLRVRGLGAPNAAPTGIGHHLCDICNVRYLTREQLNLHSVTPNHKELLGLFDSLKEQARNMREENGPRPENKNNGQSSNPDSNMIAVARAEVEMKLEPTRMELDPYILGIYESVMKPFWPVPKSTFYCRICNYVEFRDESELNRHNLAREHKKREDTYAEAFCLYCQVHNVDASIMRNHEKTEKHKKAKDLMAKTKRCAVTHWHKVNNLPLPLKYTQEWANEDRQQKEEGRVGEKRSANFQDPKMISPAKKVNTSSAQHNSRAGYTAADLRKNATPKVAATIDLTKPAEKSFDRKNPALTEKDAAWFAPINGHMCVACHVFIPNASEQANHLKGTMHSVNVSKFKKLLLS